MDFFYFYFKHFRSNLTCPTIFFTTDAVTGATTAAGTGTTAAATTAATTATT